MRAAGHPAALRLGVGERLLRVGYFRPDTLEVVITAVVNYHHWLPLTRAFGRACCPAPTGSGSRPRGRSITTWAMSRYLVPWPGHLGLHPRVGLALHLRHEGHRRRRAGEPLRARRDLGNDTTCRSPSTRPLPMGDAGSFAMFDLVGIQLSPCIRDPGKTTLYRTGPRRELHLPA